MPAIKLLHGAFSDSSLPVSEAPQTCPAASPTADDATTHATQSKLMAWLSVTGIALLFVLLRWNNFNAPLTRDEGEYGYAAQLLISGKVPYEHSFLQKPPMVGYTYAAAELLAPGAFWAPRIAAAIFAAAATMLLGYIARREFGPGTALPAMWLMTPMILMPAIDQFIANTEMFMVLPLMGAIAIYVRCRHSRGGAARWLAAGALGALAICYKYTACPMLAFLFAIWSVEEWRGGANLRELAAGWMCAAVGAVAAAGVVLAPFLIHDGGKSLWECTVGFNRFYAMSSVFGAGRVWAKLGELFSSWWILFVATGLLMFGFQHRLWFWIGMFLMAWVATAGSPFWHYYITIMPFWSLIIAVAVRGFAARVAIETSQPERWVRAAMAGFIVLVLCIPDLRWMIRTPHDFALDRLGPWGAFLESPIVAGRISQITQPRDSVYVAGSEPEILCYSHRFSPTRFDIAYPLMIPTPLARGYQSEAMRDLEQNLPAAIVLVRTSSSWMMQTGSPPEFMQFLGKLVASEYDIVGGYISNGRDGQWREPMGTEDVEKCTMVLFKRKAESAKASDHSL